MHGTADSCSHRQGVLLAALKETHVLPPASIRKELGVLRWVNAAELIVDVAISICGPRVLLLVSLPGQLDQLLLAPLPQGLIDLLAASRRCLLRLNLRLCPSKECLLDEVHLLDNLLGQAIAHVAEQMLGRCLGLFDQPPATLVYVPSRPKHKSAWLLKPPADSVLYAAAHMLNCEGTRVRRREVNCFATTQA